MYVNQHFASESIEEVHEAIEKYPFGIIAIASGGRAEAAQIPFVLWRHEGRQGKLWGHVAARDPLAAKLNDGLEALLIFNGPSAYISPVWYENPGLPTYNFIAVHVRGALRLAKEEPAVLHHLSELAEVHEKRTGTGWSFAGASTDYVRSLLPHIVAFSVEIEEIAAKFKLSQNRSSGDRDGVIRGLCETGLPAGLAVAALMRDHGYRSDDPRPLLDLSGN